MSQIRGDPTVRRGFGVYPLLRSRVVGRGPCVPCQVILTETKSCGNREREPSAIGGQHDASQTTPSQVDFRTRVSRADI